MFIRDMRIREFEEYLHNSISKWGPMFFGIIVQILIKKLLEWFEIIAIPLIILP
jgi:hypothetical protein